MAIEIIVPRLGWSMEEGAFVAWLKKDGDVVHAGEPLFSIEGDKAVQEIESLDSGVLRVASNAPKPGDSVRVGDVLGYLVAVGEPAEIETGSSSASGRAPTVEVSPAIQAKRDTASSMVTPDAGELARREAGETPAISPRALRVAMELGVDWKQVKGTGRTGRIRERDIRRSAGSAGPE